MTVVGKCRVSVTIPVFNGMPYVIQTVESVLHQLRVDDELIIVDNASTDGTTEYLQRLNDSRLRVLVRSNMQDIAVNWTQAVVETTGDYVKLVCGDDLVEAGCIEIQSRKLEEDNRLVMVAGKRTVVDDQNKILISNHGLNGLPNRLSGAEAVKRCLIAGTNLLGEPAAVMFRGDAIRSVMPWDNTWPYMLDLATYARVAVLGDVALVHHPVARFRVSPTSASSQMLKQQPRDFRDWREWQSKQPGMRLTALEKFRSNVALSARTVGRGMFFRRVARGAARR